MMRKLRKFVWGMCLVWLSGCSGDDPGIYVELYGTVKDYVTGEPLDNAEVMLLPSGGSKTTEKDGMFHFYDLDARQYTLNVRRNGYQANSKSVKADSREDIRVDIFLIPIINNE